MPEGPELHLTSLFINRVCKNRLFSGKIHRNPIHKCADIPWNQPTYNIFAESRGKELMLHLTPSPMGDGGIKSEERATVVKRPEGKHFLSLRFTFGMSGKFEFTPKNELMKHAHLSFFTKSEPKMALSFVDTRRFGKWMEDKQWSPDRGPCVIQEYDEFVNNIVASVDNPAFKRPICEVLLNQKFFNGIGNYLRAEILYRCSIPPFERASDVLQLESSESMKKSEEICTNGADITSTKQKKRTIKKETSEMVSPKTELCEEKYDGEKTSTYFTTKVKSETTVKKSEEDVSSSLNNNSKPTTTGQLNMLTQKAQGLLQLCNSVPLEVVKLGSTKYSLSDMYKEVQEGEGQSFYDWVQCYYQPGMKNMADHNKRTIWFSGPPGPLAPKEQKSRIVKKSKKSSKAGKKEEKDMTEIKVDQTESHNEQGDQIVTITRKRLRQIKNTEAPGGKKIKPGSNDEQKGSVKGAQRRSGSKQQQKKKKVPGVEKNKPRTNAGINPNDLRKPVTRGRLKGTKTAV